MLRLVCLLLVSSLVAGQDDRELLPPEVRHCADRDLHWKNPENGHWYFFSYLNNQAKDLAADWLDARNICRRHCMDLVSLEDEYEANEIKRAIAINNMPWIWTSLRKCDFTGCDEREDLQPINVNGWFWSGSGAKMPPSTRGTKVGWSPAGENRIPQPDNKEDPESCGAILNNIYDDGIWLHDINCFHAKPFVCEDSDELIRFVVGNGGLIRGVNTDVNPQNLKNPFQPYPETQANGARFRLAGR